VSEYPQQLLGYYDGLTMEVFAEARALLRERSEAPSAFDAYDLEDARTFSTETRYDRAGALGAALITASAVRSERWAQRGAGLSGLCLGGGWLCLCYGNMYGAVPLLTLGAVLQPLLHSLFGYHASQRHLFDAVTALLRSRGVCCRELP
jgi:hypothetical protein